VEAHNGQQAFEKVIELLPAALITDLALPGLDGFELVTRLRRDTRTNGIPVMAVTGDSFEDLEACLVRIDPAPESAVQARLSAYNRASGQAVNLHSLNQQLSSALFRLHSLERKAGSRNPTQKLVAQTLRELRNVLEALQVAQEQLVAQADELATARNAVAVERERYRSLFDAAPVSYLITDSQGVIEDANAAASGLLNISCRFLIGKPLSLFVGEGRAEFLQRLAMLTLAPEPADWTVQLRPRERAPLRATLHVTTVAGSNGAPSLLWLILPSSNS
jgi:PAS domain S-box-containing protein